MQGAEKLWTGQWKTKTIEDGVHELTSFLEEHGDKIDQVVCEDYRVYSWKADEHSWEGLHTPKLIGAIQAVCCLDGFSVKLRMAHEAKVFVTDERLKEWGLYVRGERHARDAIRHAVYHLIFDK